MPPNDSSVQIIGYAEPWIVSPGDSVDIKGHEVEFYVQSYLIDVEEHRRQNLVSCLDPTFRTGFAVVLRQSRFEFLVGTGDNVEVFQSSFAVNRWRWLHVRMSLVAQTLTWSIEQLNRLVEKAPAAERGGQKLPTPFVLGSNELLFDVGMLNSFTPSSFFNGRLDSPSFTTTGATRRAIAQYDFSQGISTDSIGVSGDNRHGVLVNAPTRAVKGYNWNGPQPDWTKATYGYGAIHFHEGDLDDAKWSTNFSITIPSTARSGAYAVELKCLNPEDVYDMVTFFVRPNPESTANVALVLTTFTYLAYANERMFDQTRSSAMAIPNGVSIGSGNWYFENLDNGRISAFRPTIRPILNVRPGYVHWALDRPREFSADLLMIGFLEHSGIPYDVITDHCIHTRGPKATLQYSTLITGCHPEYHSLQTLDALDDFAKAGGNLMYLGGNGFYGVADIDSSPHPYRLEVLKGNQGCRRSMAKPWPAPHYLFGTGKGKGYVINSQYSRRPGLAWIFDGIDVDNPLGENGFGGGASGDEIDHLDYELGSPSSIILLGTSQQYDDSFGLFNEESMFPMVNTLGSNSDRVRSDLVYYETEAGGAVFSVGSINWYSSLAWEGYDNSLTRITGNVLKEFIRRGKGNNTDTDTDNVELVS
ncbi:hypothetical protein UA08_09126 [Talaromyces atroroseus]|uniref:N,N-dimethylformamidase beta subunit-like C-terminal domain-containing protein n=1 Tax=Talaromyces atroroseus TaxID=1441469 RepID=A0A1Q5Q796_TALAT|nr:hypothetical protein UA08_09126 [Talaromyces atroroseus]OKL55643.1 hypothetical protein UA08_09126 [Talaromyces atroroseus]